MFKNKSITGKNNICGKNVFRLRNKQMPKMSQRALADKLQIMGLDVDKNAVQRIESGQRFVTDIELIYLAEAFNVRIEELIEDLK